MFASCIGRSWKTTSACARFLRSRRLGSPPAVSASRRRQRRSSASCAGSSTAAQSESIVPSAGRSTALKAFARAGLPGYLERSGGGSGWHLWSFFDPPLDAAKAIALGRDGRHAEAREALKRLAADCKDGETLGLLARTWKDEWTQLWNASPRRRADALAAARDTAATLHEAAEAYVEAFRASPADYYPGINALTLGSLYALIAIGYAGSKQNLVLAGLAVPASAQAAVPPTLPSGNPPSALMSSPMPMATG